jgi:hypothetical protein
MNRSSALWLILGVLAGYLVSGPSLKADEKPRRLPYVTVRGETITLVFAHGTMTSGGSQMPCKVLDESDSWVRCGLPDELSSSREQHWYDLTRVVEVVRQEK